MLTQDQIRAAMSSGMQWNTPSGQQGLPGYGGEFQRPNMPPPPPQFGPMQGAVPNGYADMFAGPIQQPQGGLMDLLGQASQQPGVGGQGMPQPQGLMDALGMVGQMPGQFGSASPFIPPVAPVPRPRPMKATTYTIRKGDTLEKLAKMFGTTVKALQKKNGIKNANRIVAGAKIKV